MPSPRTLSLEALRMYCHYPLKKLNKYNTSLLNKSQPASKRKRKILFTPDSA